MTSYALVHEWLTPLATGGSELVVRDIVRAIEGEKSQDQTIGSQNHSVDLFALIDFESVNPDSYLYGRSIGTTFLQQFPWARQGVQKYLPLMPLAIEQLDLRNYDIILSSSHAVAKGVLTAPHQFHLCYCHTPMRYAWDLTFDYLARSRAGHGPQGWLTRGLLHQLRQWDVISANRVDHFLANSAHTARRIWRCYRRRAEVLYPPVQLDRFPLNPVKQDYYLTVCRLVSYKQVGLIVRAFNQLGLPLVVIGGGPELEMLRRLARPNVQLLGPQPDRVVETYMAEAKGFVYAACEDFGISLVEAQACGTPVIAYGRGGAAETVRDRRIHGDRGTGLLFDQQTDADLVEAIEAFEAGPRIEPEWVHRHAQQFSDRVFAQRYLEILDRCETRLFGQSPDHSPGRSRDR